MEIPVIAARHPATVALEAGESYSWCQCGRSGNQPFCDGSNRSTPFTPVTFTPEETGEAALCMCKRTGNPPYCDGTHARLAKDDRPPPATKSGRPAVAPTPEEPTVKFIHDLARDGLTKTGHHGQMGPIGVPRGNIGGVTLVTDTAQKR